MTEQVIIIGSGPAGFTAAIYAVRAGLEPLLFEGRDSGGQLMITTSVDNFPGFPNGIQGPDLMAAMREQVKLLGVRIISGDVSEVELKRSPFKIIADEKEYFCKALIIATGATARWIGIPSETGLRGKGVSACATCDGFFFKGQDVLVVGGGDTALEEALYLTHFAKSVAIVHRRDKLRATKAMQDKAEANPKISFVWDSVVAEIKDVNLGKVTGVMLKNVKDGKITERPCDGVFIAIGHVPNTKIFGDQLKLDENGYIVTKAGSTVTSVQGVFAAGDVADPVFKQAVTAAGTGCMAAIEAERFIL